MSLAVVVRLAEHDSDLALEVAEAIRAGMNQGLTDDSSSPFDNLSAWVEVFDHLDPTLIDTLIAEIPRAPWRRAVNRPQRYRHSRRDQIAPLVLRAARAGGRVQAEAEGLLHRFPAFAQMETG